MKKVLIALLALFVAYYAHGRYVFSESQVRERIDQMVQAGLSGQLSVCRGLSAQARLHVRIVHPLGVTSIDSEQDGDACARLQGSALGLQRLGMGVKHQLAEVKVEREGMPWLRASAKLRHEVSVELPMGLMVRGEATSDVGLRRGFTGPVVTEATVALDLSPF